MNLFSPEQADQLRAEFPDADVQRTLDRIELRAADEPIRHPMSFARAWLNREADETPVPQARTTRGTFRPDGSWWADAQHASATEHALREFCETIARMRLSPAQAADLMARMPLVASCYRAAPHLDGKPSADCHYGQHDQLAWLESAWASTSCSTSAEEAVKRGILKRWRKDLHALYYPAEAALQAQARSEYGGDDYPDNGSPW